MNIPARIIARNNTFELTARSFSYSEAEEYSQVTVTRLDHKPMAGNDEAECNALIELFNEPAWGSC
jgi:hypothetical protein